MDNQKDLQSTKIKQVSPPNNLPTGEIDPVHPDMLPAVTNKSENLPAITKKLEIRKVQKNLPAKKPIKQIKKKEKMLPRIPRKNNLPVISKKDSNLPTIQTKTKKSISTKLAQTNKLKNQSSKKILITDEDKKKIPPIIISSDELSSPKHSKNKVVKFITKKKKPSPVKNHSLKPKNEIIDPDDIQSNFLDRLKKFGIKK